MNRHWLCRLIGHAFTVRVYSVNERVAEDLDCRRCGIRLDQLEADWSKCPEEDAR